MSLGPAFSDTEKLGRTPPRPRQVYEETGMGSLSETPAGVWGAGQARSVYVTIDNANQFTTADGGVKRAVDRSRAPTHEAARPPQN